MLGLPETALAISHSGRSHRTVTQFLDGESGSCIALPQLMKLRQATYDVEPFTMLIHSLYLFVLFQRTLTISANFLNLVVSFARQLLNLPNAYIYIYIYIFIYANE